MRGGVSQFSLFGAAAAEPSLDDLDGVLLAGGHWVRNAGDGPAVDRRRRSRGAPTRWPTSSRCARSTAPDPIVPAEGGWSVRTGFRPELVDAAARWTRGANEGPPAGFALTAGGLRLWAIACWTPRRGRLPARHRHASTPACTWPPAPSCPGSGWPRSRSARAAGRAGGSPRPSDCAALPSWSAPAPDGAGGDWPVTAVTQTGCDRPVPSATGG